MSERNAGIITGRREMAERAALELRRRIAAWRAEEEQQQGFFGRARAAFLWAVTERWCRRIEGLAATLEAEGLRLRSEEVEARRRAEQPKRRRWPWQ